MKISSPLLTLCTYIILISSVLAAGNLSSGLFMLILIAAFAIATKSRASVGALKSISAFALIVLLMNTFLYSDEKPLFSFWIFNATEAGFLQGVRVVYSIAAITVLSSILLNLLTPIELTDGIALLLKPLSIMRIPVGDIAVIMSLSLRFIPILKREMNEILEACRFRGGTSGKGLIAKARSFIPFIVPMFVSAFRRADALAVAMDARGYRKGVMRNKHYSYSKTDILMLFIAIFSLVLTIIFRRYL